MTRPIPQRYLLVIVPFLLLWGCLATDSVEHNKQLRTQDLPGEKDSTRIDPMNLKFIINPSDNQKPGSELSHPPKQNPELVYPQPHSGTQRQLGSGISPGSGQVTAHSAQLGGIHSSAPNSYVDGVQTLLDSSTRVEYKDTSRTMGPPADLYSQMHQFLDQRYTPSDFEPPQPKKSQGQSLRVLLDRYNSNGNPKIKEEVKRIMKGPIQGGLGDKFPSSILRLEHMKEILSKAEFNCGTQKSMTYTVPDSLDTVANNINWVLHSISASKYVQSPVAIRTLFVKGNGLHIKERVNVKVGSNTIVGIAFKRSATDSLQVRFIWLPNNEKYTCKVHVDHSTRHYYFVRPFLLYVQDSVEHTLTAFLLRFYDMDFTN
ncbi:hypothetical protein IWQ62_004392 [Dispira parvispora]|uniref:Uncharacterized protein n=1 Tax=Dispira parvispora TaxID=1520584 RepID=A0A9W8ASE9_9FUNG|nr:hypothetical protein IWQ62_004392 [Dispira parvispora]